MRPLSTLEKDIASSGTPESAPEKRKKRRVRVIYCGLIVGLLVTVCFFISVLLMIEARETSAVTNAANDFFEASLRDNPPAAAEHTCRRYRDSVLDSIPSEVESGWDAKIEIEDIDDNRASGRIHGHIVVGEQETGGITFDATFRMAKENDRWTVCDEKFSRGFWGYFRQLNSD